MWHRRKVCMPERLPCADCPGIKTAITFDQDGSVVETQLYESTDGASLSQGGTWKMDKGIGDGHFSVRYPVFHCQMG